ncbi:hypothetical protein FJY71_09065, partial [candidate division WOR-3 bacterium]|nr:hypothetical protein [candidate division WOR-3 bacterium]
SDMFFMNQGGGKHGWAVGTNSLGARTTDTTGTAWTQMLLGGTSTYTCVAFPTALLGFASGTDKKLHKTVDGGLNWFDAGVQLGFSTVNTLFFVDSGTGYTGTGDPRLAKTTDGGATWFDVGELSGSINDIFFLDSAHGWATGDEDIIYYADGEWTQQNNPVQEALNSVFFANEDEGRVVGNGGTILHSTDGGVNWTAESSGTTELLLGVFLPSPTSGYAVGNNGTILRYTRTGDVEERRTQDASRMTPNATIVRGVLNLGVDSRQNTAYRTGLLDVSGRKAIDLRPGPNDVSRLAPGVYFVRAGESGATAKVVVQR